MKKILFCFFVLYASCGVRKGFSEETLRIISLAPATTEILFAIGLNREIIGVSSYCDYPLEAREKEKLGSFSQPNIEKIVFLKPTIVFCADQEQAPVREQLEKLGIKVYVNAPVNMEELLSSIREIGTLVDREKEALKLIENISKNLAEVTAHVHLVPKGKRLKVFLEIWHDPLMTAGKGSFIDDLITLAGGINIAHGTKRPYSIYSVEEVIRHDPDCIIFAYMNEDSQKRVQERLGWQTVSAVRSGRLYNDIMPDWLLRPGPRAILGVKAIWNSLYGAEYGSIDD
ncbi:MAG: cobalamin-binding protein [Candidatus Aureabacteria bacterium]|nr:cobalamin-binding protein [Candidatus Auribacterota bacterium]